MRYTYIPNGICPVAIEFDIDGDVISKIKFEKGCHGNLQAVSRFAEGMTVEEIERKCKGILCKKRGTSCADQLAAAVRKAYEEAT